MPRLRADISGKRLRELMDAALGVFCRQGFERTQMADVAKTMSFAVGTLYLYVESKEALFDLVIRHTAMDDPWWLDSIEIPVATPAPGSTVEFLRSVFGKKGQWPLLEAALKRDRADDPLEELDGVVREQDRLMARLRGGLLLLMRSTLEFPALSDVFVFGLRKKLLALLERYIVARADAGQFRRPTDIAITAAALTQTIAWANLQRPYDPGFATLDDQAVEDSTVELLVHSLLAA